jgi:hypothetical protein
MMIQFSIIVFMIFIVIDDRWGLAMTCNILMATICKAKCIAVRCFGYINSCYRQLVSASTLPSAWTIIISNISILDVAIFYIAINVINRKRRCGGCAKYLYCRTSWANMYVSHTIYPIQVDKPLIPTPHSSQCERAQAFRIGVSSAPCPRWHDARRLSVGHGPIIGKCVNSQGDK